MPASLGDNLQLAYDGVLAPVLVLGASFSPGLIPLPPEISNRPLELGPNPILLVELPTGPQGVAAPIAVPATTSLAGILIQWQGFTLPGSPQFFDAISNRVVTQLATPGVPTLLPITGSGLARAAVVYWPAPVGTGKWIFAGGGDRTTIATVPQSSSVVIDEHTLEAAAGPNLPLAVWGMTSTELFDGSTVLAGGVIQVGGTDQPTAAVSRFDPIAGQFVAMPSMASARALHGAGRLPDGRIVVVGGVSNLVITSPVALSSVEIFDPSTQTWSLGPALPQAWLWGALTPLPNGDLLLTGGLNWNGTLSMNTTCRRLVTGAGGSLSWTPAAPMPTPRAAHDASTLALADGRVLVAGGGAGAIVFGVPVLNPTLAAEVYDPLTNTWSNAGVLLSACFYGSIHQLPSGLVIQVGGYPGVLQPIPTGGALSKKVCAWDPLTGVWTLLADMQSDRMLHCGAVTSDGILVLFGGHLLAGPGGGNFLVETVR